MHRPCPARQGEQSSRPSTGPRAPAAFSSGSPEWSKRGSSIKLAPLGLKSFLARTPLNMTNRNARCSKSPLAGACFATNAGMSAAGIEARRTTSARFLERSSFNRSQTAGFLHFWRRPQGPCATATIQPPEQGAAATGARGIGARTRSRTEIRNRQRRRRPMITSRRSYRPTCEATAPGSLRRNRRRPSFPHALAMPTARPLGNRRRVADPALCA